MALEPINIQLSKFEQIEVLRQEIELRGEELKETEKSIRAVLWEIERIKYLSTVHPLFRQLPQPAEAANLPQLQANREALGQAIEALKVSLTALEGETKGMQPPPARAGMPGAGAGAAPRKKFDSFDDFRTRNPGGARP